MLTPPNYAAVLEPQLETPIELALRHWCVLAGVAAAAGTPKCRRRQLTPARASPCRRCASAVPLRRIGCTAPCSGWRQSLYLTLGSLLIASYTAYTVSASSKRSVIVSERYFPLSRHRICTSSSACRGRSEGRCAARGRARSRLCCDDLPRDRRAERAHVGGEGSLINADHLDAARARPN